MKRNGPRALAAPATAIVAALWIAAACAIGAPGSATSVPSQSRPTTPASSVATPAPSVAVTLNATPTTLRSALPSANVPPAGLLDAGGAEVPGAQGSYCWHADGVGSCVDYAGFEEREASLPVVAMPDPAAPLRFSLAGSYPFVDWGASYVDGDGQTVQIGGGQSSFDPDASTASSAPAVTEAVFAAPPAHTTSIVQVFVRFAGGGDAAYGWKVSVP